MVDVVLVLVEKVIRELVVIPAGPFVDIAPAFGGNAIDFVGMYQPPGHMGMVWAF